MHTPLRGSCVSERSRCAFLRILICARAPSAGIVRVGALPLCVFAYLDASSCALRGSCVSERSRCAFSHILQLNRAPSAGIVRVGALPLCVFAHLDASSCSKASGEMDKVEEMEKEEKPIAEEEVEKEKKEKPTADEEEEEEVEVEKESAKASGEEKSHEGHQEKEVHEKLKEQAEEAKEKFVEEEESEEEEKDKDEPVVPGDEAAHRQPKRSQSRGQAMKRRIRSRRKKTWRTDKEDHRHGSRAVARDQEEHERVDWKFPEESATMAGEKSHGSADSRRS